MTTVPGQMSIDQLLPKPKRPLRVLVACEESQRVCIAFRERGHEAFSCDILDCSGGHPEWHIKGDVLPLINGNCTFTTSDTHTHTHTQCGQWDILIAFPPCTYLAVSGNRWFKEEKYGDQARERKKLREEAIAFFMKFINAECERIAVENPIGIMGTTHKKPSQVIQPYWFGDPARKSTCLWLKNLPPLKPTKMVEPQVVKYKCKNGKVVSFSADYGVGFLRPQERKRRSKTFPGIAKAMAEQWG